MPRCATASVLLTVAALVFPAPTSAGDITDLPDVIVPPPRRAPNDDQGRITTIDSSIVTLETVEARGIRPEIRRPTGSIEIDGFDATVKGPCLGNPILPATGNKIESERDFRSAGEFGLHLSRTYNHFWAGSGLFGKHWLSNFDYKITFGNVIPESSCYPRPGGGFCTIGYRTVIHAWRPDGRTIKFTKAADGIFYEAKPDPIAKIVPQPDGSFVLYGEDNGVETYTQHGYVSKVQNEHGIAWTFSYSGSYPTRVTHSSGRYVEFVWNGSYLASVRDPAGNYYRFAFDANQFGTDLHRLVSSSRPGTMPTTISYHYERADRPAALTGKPFNGVRYSSFAYDSYGRATSSEHNGQERYSFAYTTSDDGLLTVEETNPLFKKTTRVFKNGSPTATTGHPSTYCPNATYALTEYDANGNPAMESDFNNNKVAYTYNAKGQLTKTIDGYGTAQARETSIAWDGNRIVSVTVVGQSRTDYSYTADYRLAAATEVNLSAIGVPGQTRTTTYSYAKHGNGMVASVTMDGPLPGTGDAVVTAYSPYGEPISVTNGLGHATTYSSHNALGLPGRVTSPSGAVTEYEYDARGRVVVERTYPSGSPVETRYVYGASGLLEEKRTSDGNVVLYHYDDARRLIQEDMTEPGGGFSVRRYSIILTAGSWISIAARR